ncbi:MAG: PIN domain-containing protein [Lysobacteraceae bacterium]
MSDKPKIYLDAAPIIDLVKFKVGVGIDPERERDAWYLQQLLKAARAEAIDIFTSTLTLAECTHVEDRAKLEQAKPLFLQLLTSGRGGIKLVQPILAIVEDARNLRWSHGISLKGMDSIHAATALKFRCDEFLHRDGKISDSGAALHTLGMRVCAPSDTKLLPDDYRQELLPIRD